jgi:hypothetical protein
MYSTGDFTRDQICFRIVPVGIVTALLALALPSTGTPFYTYLGLATIGCAVAIFWTLTAPYMQWEEFEDESKYVYNYMVFYTANTKEGHPIFNRAAITSEYLFDSYLEYDAVERKICEGQPELDEVKVTGVDYLGRELKPVSK